MPGMTGHVSVANARRDDAIKRLKRQIDYIEGEIRRGNGGVGAGGQRNDYLVERLELLRDSRDQLQAEIARMNRLSDEDLVAEFVPSIAHFEATKDAPVADLRDGLQRGGMVPQRVDVHRNPPPVHHEGPAGGGVPWENAAGRGGPPGWGPGPVYTY